MSKKKCPKLYTKLLYKMGHFFLDIQYQVRISVKGNLKRRDEKDIWTSLIDLGSPEYKSVSGREGEHRGLLSVDTRRSYDLGYNDWVGRESI